MVPNYWWHIHHEVLVIEEGKPDVLKKVQVAEPHSDLWKHIGCKGVTMGLCPENQARKSVEHLCPYVSRPSGSTPQGFQGTETNPNYIPTRDAVGEPIVPRRQWVKVDWSKEKGR